MRRLLAGSLIALTVLAVPAGSAEQPRIRLAPTCFQSGERGTLTGAGFSPKANWTAKLQGVHPIGKGHTDRHGEIDARFTAPVYHGKTGIRQMSLSVTDGPHVAKTTFRMTPLTASFSPRTGDPATLRVRWRVLGLGPRHGVYVHYVKPDKTLRRTLRIGTTSGACGTLKTGPIVLFPFRFEAGIWTFQIDASRRYAKATTPRLLIRFEITQPEATLPPPSS
jgi:hypothetical protein